MEQKTTGFNSGIEALQRVVNHGMNDDDKIIMCTEKNSLLTNPNYCYIQLSLLSFYNISVFIEYFFRMTQM